MSEELCRQLGYHFSNASLLKMALTHRSFDDMNNERLEFLGDSIVNFIIAEALYLQFPSAEEGQLSRWRASLINRDALGNLAREFELGRYLFLGQGELKSRGSERSSILSCAMEAIIGAVYLDGGFMAIRECVLRWYGSLLQSISESENHKDPKTQLQEYLQCSHHPLPIYVVESTEGEPHKQTFFVSCHVSDVTQKVIGKGSSRRRAEQAAASEMLRILKK